MEQIYQIAWAILLVSIMVNLTTYYIAPTYLCTESICGIKNQSGINQYDINKMQSTVTGTPSGATGGTTPTTPPGFWNYLAGEALSAVGLSNNGLLSQVLIPFITFVAGFEILMLYYANLLGVPILANIIYVFTGIFFAIQAIGVVFFFIYIAGLIRGVKA